jgi:hypothetical protein
MSWFSSEKTSESICRAHGNSFKAGAAERVKNVCVRERERERSTEE